MFHWAYFLGPVGFGVGAGVVYWLFDKIMDRFEGTAVGFGLAAMLVTGFMALVMAVATALVG